MAEINIPSWITFTNYSLATNNLPVAGRKSITKSPNELSIKEHDAAVKLLEEIYARSCDEKFPKSGIYYRYKLTEKGRWLAKDKVINSTLAYKPNETIPVNTSKRLYDWSSKLEIIWPENGKTNSIKISEFYVLDRVTEPDKRDPIMGVMINRVMISR